ncbi:hypothetical protein ZIOFF_046372 [Zingiber officinale]|uniref:Uncharacterized protein n=1 Tax=Zingiber officinale TaxID=94328 RepID=A0A8J5KSG0_ZINOF|nr:hypothetical protein ZIOFF_046372 [Zingiber officinale]
MGFPRQGFKKLKAASDMLVPDFWVVGSVFGQWRSKLRKQVHPSGVFVPWFITCWVEGFDSSRPMQVILEVTGNLSCGIRIGGRFLKVEMKFVAMWMVFPVQRLKADRDPLPVDFRQDASTLPYPIMEPSTTDARPWPILQLPLSLTVKPLNSSSSSQCDGNWNELLLLKKPGYSYTEAISFQLSYHTAEALE